MSYIECIKQFLYIIFIIVIIWVIIQKTVNERYIPPETYTRETGVIDNSILTYNIQKFPWCIKSFSKGDLYDLINGHSLILLQECFDETLESLEKCFPDYYICRGNLKGLNAMNSGLVILSKFPIYNIDFYQYKNYNSFSFDLFSEKGFLSALIKVNNEYIRVINTHLQSSDFKRYDNKALLQLDELNNYLRELDKENIKYIVGGDFNIDIIDLNIDSLCERRDIHYPEDPTIFINFLTSHSRSKSKKGYDPLTFDYFISKDIEMDKPIVVESDYSDHNPVSTYFHL